MSVGRRGPFTWKRQEEIRTPFPSIAMSSIQVYGANVMSAHVRHMLTSLASSYRRLYFDYLYLIIEGLRWSWSYVYMSVSNELSLTPCSVEGFK